MNNRQKAKHFKRLYESTLPQKKTDNIDQYQLNHYKVCNSISVKEIINSDNTMLDSYILQRTIQELEPMVKQNIIAEDDIYNDKKHFTLDVWMLN